MGMARLQHPQDAPMCAFLPSMAGMPSASQMQLPNHERLPRVTGNAVGIAENGATRQSSPFSCCMKAWPSLRRERAVRIDFGEAFRDLLISAMEGHAPVRIIWR